MKLLQELTQKDLEGKKVLLRVDFNVSLAEQLVTSNSQLPITNYQLPKIEDFKIKSHLETINYLLDNGASVVMVSHIDPPMDSFTTIVEQIAKVLGHELPLISLSDFLTTNHSLPTANLVLVDNIRQDPREVQNDETFAQELSKDFDFYVNDAFASVHRKHASVSAVTKFLPSYVGFLIKKEAAALQAVMDTPAEGKILVMGGAKISTKLPVIQNFLAKAEKILIGGALANDFFQANKISVGASLVDQTPVPELDQNIVLLPQDILVTNDKTGNGTISARPVQNIESDELIADVGPQSAELFAEIIESAKMVIWNGPMGLSEVAGFAKGTEIIAKAVASSAGSIIGGGDTITAVDKLGLLGKMGLVSTGGGAMLSFLSGEKLPGLEALGYYD